MNSHYTQLVDVFLILTIVIKILTLLEEDLMVVSIVFSRHVFYSVLFLFQQTRILTFLSLFYYHFSRLYFSCLLGVR